MTLRSLLLPPLVAGAFAVLVAACGDGGTTGAMSQSSVGTRCAPSDIDCQDDGLDAPLAVGARVPLDIKITAAGVAAPKMNLESARTDVLVAEDGELVGKSPGFASVLFVGEDNSVLDFITMTVERPDRLELYRLTDDGAPEAAPLPDKIQLAPGDDLEVMVKAFVGATRLIGDLEVEWKIDNTSAATVLDSGRRGSRRLRIKAAGTTTLAITASSLEKKLDVEVVP